MTNPVVRPSVVTASQKSYPCKMAGCYMPDEVAVAIFSHLNSCELGICCQVSKAFHRIANNESLWIGSTTSPKNRTRTLAFSKEEGTAEVLQKRIIEFIGNISESVHIFPEIYKNHLEILGNLL